LRSRPAGCTSRSIPLEIIQTNYRWSEKKRGKKKKKKPGGRAPTDRPTVRTERGATSRIRGWRGGKEGDREKEKEPHRAAPRREARTRDGERKSGKGSRREGSGRGTGESESESERAGGKGTRSVLKNKKLPYIFQALTCAWVGWVGRWTGRGWRGSGRRAGPLRGVEGRAGGY